MAFEKGSQYLRPHAAIIVYMTDEQPHGVAVAEGSERGVRYKPYFVQLMVHILLSGPAGNYK